MMDHEQRFLLECVSAFINHKQISAPDKQTDLKRLQLLAEAHGLEGVVFSCCRKWMSSEKSGKGYLAAFQKDIFYSVNRKAMLKQIADGFAEENIPFICMKGAVLRDAYPVPEVRSMGDIDIIIQTKDRAKADRIMCERLGYHRFVDNHAVWTYDINKYSYQFEVEIHDHMFYENLANKVDYRSYFDQVWEHCHRGTAFGIESNNLYVPEETFHFLYLITHTAKHVINNGSGFRPYLDMALWSKRPDLNWVWLEKELNKLQLLDFAKKCFALCERWFGIEMPLGEKQLEESFFDEITDKTILDGAFGLDNAQNVGARAAKDIKSNEGSYIGGAFALTVKKIFPPYQDMQLIPWYAWVDKKPWLLPAAWVYRWFYCLRHKRSSSIELLSEPYVKRDLIQKRELLLQQWGL